MERKGLLANPFRVLVFQILVSTSAFLLAQINIVIALLLLLAMLILPGLAVIRLFDLDFENSISKSFFALMFSLFGLIAIFTSFSVFLHQIGVPRPFNSYSADLIGISILVSALSILMRRRPGEKELDLLKKWQGVHKSRFALVGLPITSLVVVEDLNFHHKSLSTTIFLISIILILIFLAINPGKYSDPDIEAWVIYAISLSLVLGSTFRGTGGFWGYDINAEFGIATKILHQGYWLPPHTSSAYESMLSITVLPVVLSLMTKLSLTTLFKLFFPLVLAAMPAVFYSICRKYVSRFISIIVVGTLIIGSISYIPQLPALARQTIGLSFFSALILLPFEKRWSKRERTVVGLMMAAGMAVSHYSTAYIASFFFGFTLVMTGYSYLLSSRRRRMGGTVFTPSFCLSVILITVIWNGLVTNSLQDVKPVLNAASSQGLNILPNSSGSFINRWLSGTVITSKATPEELKAYDLELNKKFKVTPFKDGQDYKIEPVTIPTPKPIFGNHFARTISNMLVIGRSLFQLVAILGLYLLARRFYRRKKFNQDRLLYATSIPMLDVIGLGIASVILGLVVRVSSTLAPFYNPERAAIQIALVLIIPSAIGLQHLLLRGNISQLFFAVPTVFFFIIILLTSSSLDGYLTGGDVTRISEAQTKYSPFIISNSERYASEWVSKNLPYPDFIQTDSRGFLALLQNQRTARLANLDPYSLSSRSYIYAANSNINGKIARSRLVYPFPFDFINAHYDVIYSSDRSRIYH